MALTSDQAARLASLQAAYDRLIAGAGVARVMTGGRRVDYAPGDIARLKSEIDLLNAQAVTTGRQRGAIRFRF